MKWVFIIIGGLLLIVAIVGGAGYYFMTKQSVDFSDPQVAAKFKDSFYNSCTTNAEKSLEQKGITPNDVQMQALRNICSCAGDHTISVLAKRKGMSVMEITQAMINDPEVKDAMRSCAEQNGVTLPQQ